MRPLIEGSIFTMDHHEPPYFCPVCGRAVTLFSWATVDGDGAYASYVCYGARGPIAMLWTRLVERFGIGTEPHGAHYIYAMPYQRLPALEARFDRRTGEPLR